MSTCIHPRAPALSRLAQPAIFSLSPRLPKSSFLCAPPTSFSFRSALSVCLGLMLGVGINPSHAQTQNNETYLLPDTVVTATRTRQRINYTIADINALSGDALQKNGGTILSVLGAQSGVSTLTTGGLSSTSSVFLRNHNANQTLFLIDGFRLGSATFGSVNWSLLPGSFFERAEILRGSVSSLYGADALGGVVQLFTQKSYSSDERPQINAEIGTGSWGRKWANARISGGNAEFSYLLSALSDSADGFSTTNESNRWSFNPDDDGYRKNGGLVNLSFRPQGNDRHEWRLTAMNMSGYSAYDSGRDDHHQNRDRNQLIGLHHLWREGGWQSSLRIGQTQDHNANLKNGAVFSRFNTTQEQVQWQHDLNLTQGVLLLSAEQLRQRIVTSEAFALSQRTINAWQIGYLHDFADHSLQANVRHDDNSQFGGHTTGALGYGYRFAPSWRWSISTGTSFRAPSFNDLYYPGYSNPQLKPEKGHNIETGVHFDDGVWAMSAVLFQDNISEAILSDSSTSWVPYNVGKAQIRGLGLQWRQTINAFSWRINLDHIRAENRLDGKLLTYRPEQQIKAQLSYTLSDNAQITLDAYRSSKRYTDAENTESQATQSFALIDIGGRFSPSPDWILSANINNLFDKKYITNPGYNNPRRHFFLSVRYHGG